MAQAKPELLSSRRFRLTIDRKDLGKFTACEGLGCSVEVEEYAEGGSNGLIRYLPKRLRYPPLVLSRPVGPGVGKTMSWMRSAVMDRRPVTGEIAALNSNNEVLVRWGLLDVVPVSWTGPTFSVDNPMAAMEVLEIVHHGFSESGSR